MKQIDDAIQAGARAAWDYLDRRFPVAALPGGRQLFADDAVDPKFKHEEGCVELAMAVISAYEAHILRGRISEQEG